MNGKFALIGLLLVLVLASFAHAETIQSIPPKFNVSPDIMSLNWTNSYTNNITIGTNSSVSSMTFNVSNATHSLTTNYSQALSTLSMGTLNAETCGLPGKYFNLTVASGSSGNTTAAVSGGQTTGVIVNFSALNSCPVGRYFGNLTITNSTNATDHANMTVIADIPISTSNTLNSTSGTASISGKVPLNATTYQSYYFNVSQISAKTIFINMSWSDQTTEDIDLFLFNGSTLMAKSINNSGAESMYFGYLGGTQVWELRVYGNSSSLIDYSSTLGNLFFSTLNATNDNLSNATIAGLDLGDVNASVTNKTNITLRNGGSINYTSIVQTLDLYREENISSSSSGNFSLEVPDFATKIEIGINWTGSTNYTLKLMHPNGTVIDTSLNKYVNANVSGAEHEEFVDYTPSSSIGFDADGTWVVNVTNNTGASSFTIKSRIYYPASSWISTNFTTGGLNMTGLATDNRSFQANITIQNSTLSGTHRGNMIYTTNYGSVVKVPFEVNVTTPELLVNGTYNRTTIRLNETIGFNRTIIVNVNATNNGNVNMTFDQDLNATLVNTGSSSRYINISYADPSNITPGSSTNFNVTLDLNTSNTADDDGLYVGWISLNDADAHPYGGFNLTFEVNLTDDLDVFIRNITNASNGHSPTSINTTNENNITLDIEVFYTNGTELNDDTIAGLTISNFSGVYIEEINTSNILPNTTGFAISQSQSGASNFHNGNVFKLNVTIPANSSIPGGYYRIYTTVTDLNGTQIVSGTGTNTTIQITATGLKMTSISKPSTLDIDEEGTINVTVINYGTIKATDAKLNISLDNDLDSLDFISGAGCESAGASSDEVQVTFTLDKQGTCYVAWNVTGDEASDQVTNNLIATSGVWYGNSSFSITVNEDDSSSSDSDSGSGSSGSSAANDTHEIEFTSYPATTEVTQGQNKSVIIKIENTGSSDEEDLEIYVSGVDSSWYSAPGKFDLKELFDVEKNLTFSIPEDGKVKEYSIKYGVKNDNLDSMADAKLKVLPSNKTIEMINTTYLDTESKVEDLENLISDLDLNETQTNATEEQLQTIKDKLQQAKEAMDAGDYFTAASLLTEADELIEALSNSLDIDEESLGGLPIWAKILLWTLGGVLAIGAVGIVIYMFLPPKEAVGVAKVAVRQPATVEKKPPGKKLKEKIKSIFKRKPHGYRPGEGYVYKPK